MKRIPLIGVGIVIGHSLTVVWHLIVLAQLRGSLSTGQVVLFSVLINLLPLTALILPWPRYARLAGWFLLVPFGLGLTMGGYAHFLSNSPDNVFRVAAGEWTTPYRVSATLLLLLQLSGRLASLKIQNPGPGGLTVTLMRLAKPPVGVPPHHRSRPGF